MYLEFITSLHSATKRDYIQRVVSHDKAECSAVAKQFGKDYWDGERCFGYGGYRYDGRWRSVAEAMAHHYDLRPGMRLLDIGCGKGFLLHEFCQVVPGLEVVGLDISTYAIENAKEDVRDKLILGCASDLPFKDKEFDVVVSLGAMHNLPLRKLQRALSHMERVGHRKYMLTESFRNERERVNLLYWQLTCEAILSPDDWEWMFEASGYTGDHGFIYFE